MTRYRTTIRPAAGGGVPAGVRWVYVELPYDATPAMIANFEHKPVSAHRYGVFEADRRLTGAEMRHFDILEVAA